MAPSLCNTIGALAIPAFYVYVENDLWFPPYGNALACRHDADLQIREALTEHASRVHDPSLAELFVVPYLLSCSLEVADGLRERRMLSSLRKSWWFARNQGSDHLVFASGWKLSNWWYEQVTRREAFWRVLARATATRYEVYNMSLWNNSWYWENTPLMRPAELFRRQWEESWNSIVVPMESAVPFADDRDISFERWRRRPLFVLYRARTLEYHGGSEQLRRVPVRAAWMFPNSSIGYELPADEWRELWPKARFCLSLRGDTPTSHALYNALAAGCIPVVISDSVELVGVPFQPRLPLHGYAVRIKERILLHRPRKIVKALLTLPRVVIKEKLAGMSTARQALSAAHPRSTLGSHVLAAVAHRWGRPSAELPEEAARCAKEPLERAPPPRVPRLQFEELTSELDPSKSVTWNAGSRVN